MNKEIISPLSPLPPAPSPLSLCYSYSHQTPLTLISKYVSYISPHLPLSLRYLTRACRIFATPTQHFTLKLSAFIFPSLFALVLLAWFSIFLIGGNLLLRLYLIFEVIEPFSLLCFCCLWEISFRWYVEF